MAGVVVLGLLGAACLTACNPSQGAGKSRTVGKQVIVIGFDGMDPRLCTRLMDEGSLPTLAKMRAAGGFAPLGTSIPPQSPVAWASFITGADPGVHGIFDFIHRDPTKQCAPYYSAAETVQGDGGWQIGDYRVPLTFWPFEHNPTQTLLRRYGTPFWDYLDEAGIKVRLYDIPANYPPSPSHHGHMCCLSGMGVPDLLGGYGTYQFFSEDTQRSIEEDGGQREPIRFTNHEAQATLLGPQHTYLSKPVYSRAAFTVYRHAVEPWARIELQGQTIVLKEGEWSDWVKVDYTLEMPPFLPAARANGICRFYLQAAHPTFRLYVTPINIDPSDPAGQKVSEPPDFVTRISEKLGLFYTAGFQEDHKALRNRVFNDAEYHRQVNIVLDERLNLLEYAREHYTDGLLFFYFSSTDLQAHMYWWDSDEPHPVRTPEEARRYHGIIEELYRSMDRVVGQIVDEYGEQATILVMSDHGFCNFRRQFNLNTWLRDEGYLNPPNCRSLLKPDRQPMVDWSKTRAYGLGLNGLYVNLQGRERDGVVHPKDHDALLEELSAKLLAVRDPENGASVIKEVYRADKVYSGPRVVDAPDLIVGYYRGYRASWATTMGDMTDAVVDNNDAAWSADHCIAASEVPGVIFSNRPLVQREMSLIDMAPTILAEFGIVKPATMKGRSILAK